MPSIKDFSGGVINQELATKDNGGGFVIDCKNVVSSCNGELRRRTGTRWLATLNEDSRMIPFRRPDGNDCLLVFSNNKVNGYSYVDDYNIEQIREYSGESPIFPAASNWTSNSISDGTITWTISTSSTYNTKYYTAINPDTAYTISSGRGVIYYKYSGQLLNWSDWSSSGTELSVTLQNSTPTLIKTIKIVNGYSAVQSSTIFPAARDLQTLITNARAVAWAPKLQYSDDCITWTTISSNLVETYYYGNSRTDSTNQVSSFVTSILTQNLHTIPHLYWRVSYTNQKENTGVSTSPIPNYPELNKHIRISNVEYYPVSGGDVFEATTPFTTENLQNLKYAQVNDNLIVCDGINNPQKYTISGETILASDYILSASPSSGLYVDGNFPSCCCFFQNRLWFSGFPSNKTTVIGSKFNVFDNFTIPATVLSTSPIEVKSVEIKSIVENLYGGNLALYGLSADGISMIDAQGSIVATNNIEFKLRNREPVNEMTPTEKDDIMIYLGLNKKNIFITDYDYIVQRFKAHDISSNYNNYFESGISELHYIPQKSRYIYGLNSDGSFFALLFEIDKEKNALFPFNTNGRVLDISKIKYNNNIRLVMVVERNGRFFIEEKNTVQYNELFDLTTPEQQKIMSSNVFVSKENYVDCSTFYLLDGEKTTLLDVPYQVGDKVQCITEAGYCGELLVEDGDPVLKYKWHASVVPPEGFPQYVYVSTDDYAQLSVGDIVYSKQTVDGVDYFSIVGIVGGFYTNGFYIQSEFENQTLYHASMVSESAIITGSTKVELPGAYYQVILGYSYESYAVIKFTVPYTSQKYLTEIATNFINTGYLELGSSFENLEPIVGNLVDNVYLDDRPILMNGIYKKTITKETEFSPYLIVSSDKGLPFTITGINYKIDYSNYQGGV